MYITQNKNIKITIRVIINIIFDLDIILVNMINICANLKFYLNIINFYSLCGQYSV